MEIPLIILFSVVTLYSLLFTAHRYRKGTPAQRQQIIYAACGAVAVATTIFLLIGFR